DVYLDTTPGAGFTEGIPGRRVSFAPADAWDHAIVLTPQPYKVRAVLEGWGPPGAHVSVPADVYTQGPTAIARVPLDRLGGPPAPHWGYAIAVSGARWDETLAVVDLLTDERHLDAYTLPVHTVAENEAFGGGALGDAHTQVIDVFTPPGQRQRDALAGRAILPMNRLEARPPTPPPLAAAAPAEAPPAAGPTPADPTIKDILDTTVVITGAPPTAPYRLAEVYGPDGRRAGKVVVTAIHPEFVTATIVEGLATIQRGMTVRFPEPAQDAEE
ncbi:MAG: glucodextranase DOMON-like domain-containing protein, partial [bacterium]